MRKNQTFFIKLKKTAFFLLCLIAVSAVLFVRTISSERMDPFGKLLTGILLVICLGIFLWFMLRVYLPGRKLLDAVRSFNKADANRLEIPGGISQEVEAMAGKMSKIMERREMLKLSIEQSKYLALQNQINPHFLYNTLDAIRGDALEMGMINIADVTEALSTFFRYSVSKMDKIATLEEELGNINDYYLIQRYRFGSRLNLEILNQDNEDIYSLCLPRMSLQPLIENAIYHGLEGREEMGSIRIYLQRTQTELLICIVDDGIGMSFEQADILNEMLSSREASVKDAKKKHGGIAISNVNERIKLLFGEKYGLRIFSEEDIGTEVRLIVPAIQRGDYNQTRVLED